MRIILVVAALTIIAACAALVAAEYNEPQVDLELDSATIMCIQGMSDWAHRHCVYEQDVSK